MKIKNLAIEYFIANRYLKTKRKESFISVISWFSLIGIMLGVAVLIIVMSVMNGFRKDIVSNIVGINGHVVINGFDDPIVNSKNVSNKIMTIKEVTNSSEVITSEALISSKNNTSGSYIKFFDLNNLYKRKFKNISISKADLDGQVKDTKVIILGKDLARDLNVTKGDIITVIFPKTLPTLMGVVPKYARLKVIGTFTTGMYQYDSGMAIAPLSLGQDILEVKGVSDIEIFIKNPEDSYKIRDKIDKMFFGKYYIDVWQENNSSFISALNTERDVMFLILTLIIIIAAFNIISSLIMLTRSKTKEIAILKTLGFREANISRIFFIIGLRIGVLGTIWGVALGVFISLYLDKIKMLLNKVFGLNLFNEEVYFLANIPVDLNIVQVLFITFIAIIFTVLASIYPAVKASKIEEAKALRYE